jgi:hypothetical protein
MWVDIFLIYLFNFLVGDVLGKYFGDSESQWIYHHRTLNGVLE